MLDVVLTGTRSVLSPWFQDYDPSERARAEAQLAAVGCSELAGRGFATCSQGERQRVLLARAMVAEPRLLVLDEPSAGLDLPSREALIAALERSIRERPDLTVVLATHHLEEIPPSATHAALLRDGCLVSSGPIEEALTREHLTGCFGIDVEVSRREGRWFGTARTDGVVGPGQRSSSTQAVIPRCRASDVAPAHSNSAITASRGPYVGWSSSTARSTGSAGR